MDGILSSSKFPPFLKRCEGHLLYDFVFRTFSFRPKLLTDLCRINMLSLLYLVEQVLNYTQHVLRNRKKAKFHKVGHMHDSPTSRVKMSSIKKNNGTLKTSKFKNSAAQVDRE